MRTLPNPWISASAAVVMPVADQAAASCQSPRANDAAAAPFGTGPSMNAVRELREAFDGPDIPMTVLMRRGFDPEQFLSDCEPPPLFLEGKPLGADDLMPVLAVLAGH